MKETLNMEGIEPSEGGSVPKYNINTSNAYDTITDLDLSTDGQEIFETVMRKKKT